LQGVGDVLNVCPALKWGIHDNLIKHSKISIAQQEVFGRPSALEMWPRLIEGMEPGG